MSTQTLRLPASIVLAAAATVAIWWWLDPRYPQASWLHVQAPTQAHTNRPFTLQVQLQPNETNHIISADLHWLTTRREPRRVLCSAPAQTIHPGHTQYVFDFHLPSRPDLGHLVGVIALGPTDRWSDRTRAATTDPVPVRSTPDPTSQPFLLPLHAAELRADPEPPPSESSPLWRTLNASLWFMAAGLALRRTFILKRAAATGSPRPAPLWAFLALLAALFATWECFHLEAQIGELGRTYAFTHRVYHEREPVQRLVTAAITGGALALALASVRYAPRWPKRLLLLGTGTYLALIAAAALSLHAVDHLGNLPLLDWPLLPLLKLVATSCAVTGIQRSGRAPPPKTSSSQRMACHP